MMITCFALYKVTTLMSFNNHQVVVSSKLLIEWSVLVTLPAKGNFWTIKHPNLNLSLLSLNPNSTPLYQPQDWLVWKIKIKTRISCKRGRFLRNLRFKSTTKAPLLRLLTQLPWRKLYSSLPLRAVIIQRRKTQIKR